MSGKLTEKVPFDFIRYANCWEDAGVLLEGLNPAPKSKILSVGSAGDNSFSLLTTDPELLVAVDINRIQLYLIELKKAGIQHLSHKELLAFLGFKASDQRQKTFDEIKESLSNEARKFWESNIIQIKQGIISQGKFEHYFQLFSSRVLPWIHSKKTIEELFRSKNEKEQKQFYDKHWNTWKWRLLFKVFFSKYVMGKYGRDPGFLKEVSIPVGAYIFQKAEKHLQSIAAQNNFILRYNLTGSFGDLLPHYLRPENFGKIKSNLGKLVIKQGYAEEAFQEYGTFEYMNLSNIFEYMEKGLFAKTARQLIDFAEPGGRLAYWNLMVPRRISEIFPGETEYLKDRSLQLSARDKGFFYQQFIIDQLK